MDQTKPGSDGLTSAKAVLKTEADALLQMADELDGPFTAALDLLDAAPGRVVVTGMGKSGHIARKIAATLASTGQPSFFVHPGEASHGDLGMILEGDAVIALSNSGETTELSDIIAYTRRYRIGLVGLTGRAGSTLTAQSDVALVIPDAPEACPMGLAPTTSTTAMLAMGDAIAVCLLERKGFTAQDFHNFHPGGKLGQLLLKVADLMHGGDAMPVVDGTTPMSEALLVMTSKGFGVVGVTGPSGALDGVITDGDLRRHMSKNLIDQIAADVMTAGGITIAPDHLASEALAIMNEHQVTTLFVVDAGRPVGIVHIHDCLRVGVA